VHLVGFYYKNSPMCFKRRAFTGDHVQGTIRSRNLAYKEYFSSIMS